MPKAEASTAAAPKPIGEPSPKDEPTDARSRSKGKAQTKNSAEISPRRRRVALIKKIEAIRKSRVVCFATLPRFGIEFWDTVQLYSVLRDIGKQKNIDLLLESHGGDIDAAFKMVGILREFVEPGGRLGILVPFLAKSAASLLALGADEIVMGPIAELGPIDPQIFHSDKNQYVPAQSVRDFLSYCHNFATSDAVCSGAESREVGQGLVLALIERLPDPLELGTYERLSKMAEQYAITVLCRGMFRNDASRAKETARKLAQEYYGHGYVIDRGDARDNLGLNVAFADGDLAKLMWELVSAYWDMRDRVSNLEAILETTQGIAHRSDTLRKGQQE